MKKVSIKPGVDLYVRPGTKDEELAREVFNRNYYFSYGGLKINPGDIVLDLGANIGSFAIQALQFEPKLIYCFEPHPETFEVLQKNTKGQSKIVPINCAMGKDYGEAKLYLSETSTGNHSLDERAGEKNITVKTTSLNRFFDDYDIKTIDFMKVDIEGGEYMIFEDFRYFDKVKQISFEWHYGPFQFTELLRLLIKNGFIVAWFEGDNKRGKLQVVRG